MKFVSESLVSEMKQVQSDENTSSALCIVEGPCMEFDRLNRNNRIYSRKLIEDRILNNPTIQEMIKNRAMLGEGGHPEKRVDISYPEVALAVEKLWIPKGEDHLLYGRFAILDTPVGHILDTLIRYGSKIGISARAMTESYMKDGHEIISEKTYELVTFDAVPEPGFKSARLEKVECLTRPLNTMTINELQSTSSTLKSLKIPAFESRIRQIDKEIKLRTVDESVMPKVLEGLKDVVKELKTLKETQVFSDRVYCPDSSEPFTVKANSLRNMFSELHDCIAQLRSCVCIQNKEHLNTNEDYLYVMNANEALRQEISRLDGELLKGSISPSLMNYIYKYNNLTKKLESLVQRLEFKNSSISNKERKVEGYSRRYNVDESRIKSLVKHSAKGGSLERRIASVTDFERDNSKLLKSESFQYADNGLNCKVINHRRKK